MYPYPYGADVGLGGRITPFVLGGAAAGAVLVLALPLGKNKTVSKIQRSAAGPLIGAALGAWVALAFTARKLV